MPKPKRVRPFTPRWYNVRMRRELRDLIKVMADRDRRSVARMAEILLEQALEAHAAARGR